MHSLASRYARGAARRLGRLVPRALRSDPFDAARAQAMVMGGQGEALLRRLTRHSGEVWIDGQRVLTRRAAACLWLGMLPERCMQQLDAAGLLALVQAVEAPLREAAADAPDCVDVQRLLARNLWMQGRHGDALVQFARAEESRHRFAQACTLPVDARVVLPGNCTQVIGLMGHLDAFIKMKQLQGDSRPYHLTAPAEQIVNPVFFAYWQPYLAGPLPELAPVSQRAALTAYTVDWNWAMPQGDTYVHVHTGIARIQRAWAAEKRPPLLQLHEAHRALLQQFCSAQGMGEGDWFVCLHVRSGAFYDDAAAQDFRNSPIADYTEAMLAVVQAGGWVIRMGDPAMPPLDAALRATGRVIDYAHHPARSAALDVALCAGCRLFVSTSSGLHTVAHAFGRPVCYVNIAMYAGFPWHPGEVFIPKLYYSTRHQRPLTMAEIMGSALIHADHQHLFAAQEVELRCNTADEIRETVLEALAHTEAATHTDSDAFARLNAAYASEISGRLGRYFAHKHAAVLFPPTRAEAGGDAAIDASAHAAASAHRR